MPVANQTNVDADYTVLPLGPPPSNPQVGPILTAAIGTIGALSSLFLADSIAGALGFGGLTVGSLVGLYALNSSGPSFDCAPYYTTARQGLGALSFHPCPLTFATGAEVTFFVRLDGQEQEEVVSVKVPSPHCVVCLEKSEMLAEESGGSGLVARAYSL